MQEQTSREAGVAAGTQAGKTPLTLRQVHALMERELAVKRKPAQPRVVRFSQLNRAQRRAHERLWRQRRRRAIRRQRRAARKVAREAAAVREQYYAEVCRARAASCNRRAIRR